MPVRFEAAGISSAGSPSSPKRADGRSSVCAEPRNRDEGDVLVRTACDTVHRVRERDFLRLVDEIAARDDGIVTRDELLQGGALPGQVGRGTERGLLTAVMPGVYAHGLPALSQRALLRVAVGYAGPRCSGLSHRCSGEHLRMLDERYGYATVVTTRRGLPRTVKTRLPMTDGKPGTIWVRSTEVLDVRVADGIACTPVPRTLVDIAGSDGSEWLERAWKGAAYRRLLDPAAIRAELAGPGKRKGAVLTRELVDRYFLETIASSDYLSLDEIDVHQALLEADLGPLEVNPNLRVGGKPYRPDFLYRALKIVIEVDDPSHDHPVAVIRDRERDAMFTAAGYLVLRFKTARLRNDLAGCVAEIAAAVASRTP